MDERKRLDFLNSIFLLASEILGKEKLSFAEYMFLESFDQIKEEIRDERRELASKYMDDYETTSIH